MSRVAAEAGHALLLAVAEGCEVPDDALVRLAEALLDVVPPAVEVLRAEPGERRLWAAARLASQLLELKVEEVKEGAG